MFIAIFCNFIFCARVLQNAILQITKVRVKPELKYLLSVKQFPCAKKSMNYEVEEGLLRDKSY